MESQEDALAVTEGNSLTLFDKMVGQAVNTALWEHFTTCFACVLVAIAGILEFLASNKEFEDQLVRLAAHSLCCVDVIDVFARLDLRNGEVSE